MIARFFLVLGGVGAALLAGEIGLRLFGHHLNTETQRTFRLDPDLGYQEEETVPFYGALAQKMAGQPRGRRVFFMGDSVTARRTITLELRRLYGEQRYEFFNGGQEGFSAVQLVRLFFRYLRGARLDQLVYFFHNNDFQESRVCYFRPWRKEPVLLDPHAWTFSGPLFLHSRLYRAILGKPGVCPHNPVTPEQWRRAETAARRELRLLRDHLLAQKVRFTVVLLPSFHPGPWPPGSYESRRRALKLFEELGLHSVDLKGVYDAALAAGITVQEQPGDMLHPSSELGRRMAVHLKQRARLLQR